MKLAQRYEKLKRDYEILKAENKRLKEENQELKQGHTGYDRLLILKALMQKCGTGLVQTKNALDKFDWNAKKAYEYLYIKGDCLVRKRKDGKPWEDIDYVNYINNTYKEN